MSNQQIFDIIVSLLSAAGLWKVIELILQYWFNKGKTKVSIFQANVETTIQSMGSFMDELQETKRVQNEVIEKQRKRIDTLELKNQQLQEEVLNLRESAIRQREIELNLPTNKLLTTEEKRIDEPNT